MFLKKLKDLLDIKTYSEYIVRIQAYNSIMRGYFFTGFIDFMFANKTLMTLLVCFLLIILKKNDKIILKSFK